MPASDYFLNQAASIAEDAVTLRINNADDFAIDSVVVVNNIATVATRLTGYVNNSVNNLKLLDGSLNILSEKTVSTAIDASVNVEDIFFKFDVERGI